MSDHRFDLDLGPDAGPSDARSPEQMAGVRADLLGRLALMLRDLDWAAEQRGTFIFWLEGVEKDLKKGAAISIKLEQILRKTYADYSYDQRFRDTVR